MKPAKQTVAFALLAAVIAGCTALQPPRVESPTLYLLDAQTLGAAQRPRHSLVLTVETPRARPGFTTPQMAYVREPHRLDYYANNRWVDAPTRMLAPLLAQALAQAGIYRAVVPASNLVDSDLSLDTELIRLQQDFQGPRSRVQLALRAQLIDSKARTVLATKQFDIAEDAPSADARGGAIAANLALTRLLRELVDFCSAASERR